MNVKITKQSHAFEGYVILYYVEILSSFNPELQFKDDKSATKYKPIDLLPKLKSFKFVTKRQFQSLKRYKAMIEQYIAPLI